VVYAPEHASEAAAVKVDRLQHLTTFANAHATLVGEVGPHPPVRQASVGRDVEGREPFTRESR